MAIFSRYEREQEETVNEKPEWKKKLPVSRQRKKKETPKPWGKKERYLIATVLLLTVLTSGILALSARSWKLPGLPRIKGPSLNLFRGETIIIEGDSKTDNLAMKNRGEATTKEFKEVTKNSTGVYGLFVVDLQSGYSFGVNENETFNSASLNKLFLMAAMYKEEESGGLDLDSKYILQAADKAEGAGSLAGKPVGYEITYRNLIRLMGKQSDNTAFKISKNLIGEEKVNTVIRKAVLVKTNFIEFESSPKDIGTFFAELWQGNILNQKNKTELLGFLTDTIYEEYLKAGVPQEIRVAHKYGTLLHIVNDGGVVYAEKPYVVVILTKGIVEKEAKAVFPQLSKIVYGNLTKQ